MKFNSFGVKANRNLLCYTLLIFIATLQYFKYITINSNDQPNNSHGCRKR